ncbi:MAG: ABC transporter permease [Gemmatimonadota bacterium]|jgi:predicted permease
MSALSDDTLPRPPRSWHALLRLLATEADRAYLLDDLDERFRILVERRGHAGARRWYVRQSLLSILPLIRRRIAAAFAALSDTLRAMGAFSMMDLVHSLRLLRKNLGTTTAAVLSLVIGITLSATIFSVVDWLWLRSSPFSEPDRIVRVFAADREGTLNDFGYADFQVLREQTTTMEDVAAAEFRGAMLTDENGNTQVLLVELTSRNYFDVLGIRPSVGIVYRADDDAQTVAEPGVVISHSLWTREFGGDPTVVGGPIHLTGKTYTILGVAPRGYAGLRRMAGVDVWYPVETWWGPSAQESHRGGDFNLLGRIAPGTDVERVRAEVGTVMARLDIRDEATRTPMEPVVMTDAAYQTRNYGGAGALLMALVTVVLIIACANVAGLQLARTLVRQQEMAIRMALGGRRVRLIRQLLVEGLMVAGVAVVVSLALSSLVLDALPRVLPPQPVFMQWGFRLDARVVGFTVALAFLSAIVFSLPPALRASRPDVQGVLKGNDLATRRSGRPVRSLNVLVVGQLALSLVLVSTTALLFRSFLATRSADLGVGHNNVLVSWIWPRMDQERLPAFYADLVEQVEALPGVGRATMARTVPFFPSGGGASLKVHTPDASGSTLPQGAAVKFNLVGPGYFDIVGTRVLRGRPVTAQDGPDDPRVALVNQTMAKRLWPGEDPLGRTLRFGGPDADPVQVVGVVEDGKYNDLEEPQEPYLYLPFSQKPWGEVMLLTETAGDPNALAPQVRRIIAALNPDTYQLPQTTLARVLRDATYDRELMALALGVFAVLGLVLAVVGLYGVSSHAVSRRRREIGIRVALGADGGRIVRQVLSQGGRLVLWGAALGVPAAVAVGLLLGGSLYGVSPVDPLSLAAAAVILGLVTLSAVLLPSRRAASLQPIEVIRYE